MRTGLKDDIMHCNELCIPIHGFARELELRHAMAQGVAAVVEVEDEIAGYSTGIGMPCRSVAQTNEDLRALISSASVILGPGFLVPACNTEQLTWVYHSGLRIRWPGSLMSVGKYVKPMNTFLPSLAY